MIKYFSGNQECLSQRWMRATEFAQRFPGVEGVCVDSISKYVCWLPGALKDGQEVPITRIIDYAKSPSLHKCDARRQHAKGRKCECACGGKNHGIGS